MTVSRRPDQGPAAGRPGASTENRRRMPVRSSLPGIALPIAVLCGLLWLAPGPAYAVQEHGSAEGVLHHQAAHLFFLVAMGLLILRLRQRGLVRHPGWRKIQIAALFFVFWNADAFFAHLLDEQWGVVAAVRTAPGWVHIEAGRWGEILAPLYYLARLDHLLCVPAMAFLHAGLRDLRRRPEAACPGEGEP